MIFTGWTRDVSSMRNVWFAGGSDTVVLSGPAWLLQWLVSATALEDVTG